MVDVAAVAGPTDNAGFFRALRNRNFALLWAGQSVSRLGDAVYRVALAWWVLEETGSAAAMGAVLIFSFAPMLAFVLIGGVLVDRISRMRVMFWADVVRGLATLLIAAVDATGALDLGHVFAASVAFGLAAAFFQPAYAAAVPEVVPPADRPSANSLNSLSQHLTGIGGPAIGAVFIALGGAAAGFAVNGLSFVAAAACVLLVPWGRVGTGVRHRGILGDLTEGFATVASSTWLWITISLAALVNLTLAGPMSVALPYFLKEERGEGAASYGLLLSCAAAGAVVVALVVGRRARLRRRGLLAYAGLVGNGLMLIAFATDAPTPVLWAAAVAGGAALELFSLVWVNTLQELVPQERLGRVFSVDQLGSFALLPVAYALAGWATSAIGAREVLLAGGLATTGLALLGLLHPAIRRLD